MAPASLSPLLATAGCNPPGSRAAAASDSSAAAKSYVAPGEKDEFYLFYSGGHSGQVYVAGLPSMRHISTIPVFAPYPATGYGFDEESKQMMGRFTWGDVHHPGLSQTGGKYDGRWLFVNDNANNRIARIDLRDFKTKQILGPIPNSSGNHGSSFVTENSEYVLVATRFSVPLPKGRYADPSAYKTEFNGMVSGIKVDPKTGEMSVGWQILTPPFNWDLGSTGKGPSSGWAFWTSYNSEMAHETLEANSTQGERDYAAIVNWRAAEQAVKDGKATMIDGVPVIDPAKVPGVIYFLPVPKSPHGIDTDPSGRWIAASGKLQPVTSVFDFEKIQKAIAAKTFDGDVRGIPVIKYEAVHRGRGPGRPRAAAHPVRRQGQRLHVAVRRVGGRQVDAAAVERRAEEGPEHDRHRQDPGALQHRPPGRRRQRHQGALRQVPGGDEQAVEGPPPLGRAVAAGEQPADRHHRPEDGDALRGLHRAGAALRADPQGRRHRADRGLSEGREPRTRTRCGTPTQTGVTRNGNKVEVKMVAIRSRFVPDKIEVKAGDEVTIHVTNVEQTTDMIHGLGIIEHDMNVVVDPGETKTVKFIGEQAGRLSLLLHQLLLGAPPGDAGLSRRQAVAGQLERSRIAGVTRSLP